MTDKELAEVRIGLVQTYLEERGYNGILLNRVDNFAMATGGRRNYVNVIGDMGACGLYVPREGRAAYVGNTIESTRVLDEELNGFDFDVADFLWFEGDGASAVAKKYGETNIVSDDGSIGGNVNAELAYLRSLLTPLELEKYRALGALAAEGMTETIEAIEAGMTEPEIAALLQEAGATRECWAPVCLIAVDERIAWYRHPLPSVSNLAGDVRTPATLKGYVMVVGCFMRDGLTVSLTRFKRVGEISNEIVDAYPRICAVDAVMQEASEGGRTLGDVFRACQDAYKRFGFPENEWHNHHQGGATGYQARTCKGAPGERFPILDVAWSARLKAVTGIDCAFGQAFAWNPSARGVKSEDTFLLHPDGSREIVTQTPRFPQVDLPAVLGEPTAVAKSGMWE